METFEAVLIIINVLRYLWRHSRKVIEIGYLT